MRTTLGYTIDAIKHVVDMHGHRSRDSNWTDQEISATLHDDIKIQLEAYAKEVSDDKTKALEIENRRLRAALEEYANPDHWSGPSDFYNSNDLFHDTDGTTIARMALAEVKE